MLVYWSKLHHILLGRNRLPYVYRPSASQACLDFEINIDSSLKSWLHDSALKRIWFVTAKICRDSREHGRPYRRFRACLMARLLLLAVRKEEGCCRVDVEVGSCMS